MKTLLVSFLFIIATVSYGQKDKFVLSLGANWSPTIKINQMNELKVVLPSYSPQLEVAVGVKGLKFFARLGNVLNFGFRAGNNFLMGGLSYSYSPFSEEMYRQSVNIELYYHRKLFRNVYLLLYTKHGILLSNNKYIFSPVNIGLNFRIN